MIEVFKTNVNEIEKAKKIEEKIKERSILNEIKLLETTSDNLIKAINQNRNELWKITPRQFEELIADILRKMNFEVTLTPQTRDGGKDIIVKSNNVIAESVWFVQCKHYSLDKPVGIAVFREVVGTHLLNKPNKSIIVTSSYYTKEVINEVEKVKNIINIKDYKAVFNWIDWVTEGERIDNTFL